MSDVFKGYRVVDFGQGLAGPVCGQWMADHGADVIKVEPPRGDWSRTMGTSDENGFSAPFVSANRNKRAICLDLRRAAELDVARRLCRRADVVIENFRPDVMGRLGLAYETLSPDNPRLIYCAISGFGHTGPHAQLPASDTSMQAFSGLMSISGDAEGEPMRVGTMVIDMAAANQAFAGILLAVIARHSSGTGQRVRVSLLDAALHIQAPVLVGFLQSHVVPRRSGNENPLFSPAGSARTSDGSIIFTVFDHYWEKFCTGMAMPSLYDDPRFSTATARQSHRDELKRELAPLFASATSAQWLERFKRMGIQCAPVHDYAQLVSDPQVAHNAIVEPFGIGGWVGVRNPVRLEGDPISIHHRPPPRLGEHTREILEHDLGLSEAHIAALMARSASGVD